MCLVAHNFHPRVSTEDTMELDLKVSGMMCGGCADSVTTALKVCEIRHNIGYIN